MASSTYRKCFSCGESFNKKYFHRHKCIDKTTPYCKPSGLNTECESIKVKDMDIPNVGYQSQIVENTREEENIENDDFDFLFEELYSTGENTHTNENDEVFNLIKWFCIILAYWQMHFNIRDTAIEFLLTFISILLKKFSNLVQSADAQKMSEHFPSSLYMFHKLLGIKETMFTKYVVCVKCYSLYSLEESKIKVQGEYVSRVCPYQSFPNHRSQHLRKSCGQKLLRVVKSVSGSSMLIPFKTFCYQSIEYSLQVLLQREEFLSECNSWRQKQNKDCIYSDVYDGAVWKNFRRKGEHYFKNERNLAVMLNVDWFQPFKHVSSFSVGGIYMVVMNLPREIRFKKEDVVLVGIIPSMDKEPPTNTFLKPLVDELNSAWENGFKLKSPVSQQVFTYHLALLCVGCDIPASRKLCGFLGHSATKGCSKCNKSFPGGFGSKDYSGFDVENWKNRTTQEHREQMYEISNCTSLTDKEKMESKYGTRYSVLAELPYFDTVRMTPIDPMHNLFMGTSKLMIKLWKERGLLNRNSQLRMQERVDQFVVPYDVGKIPRKIISGFDGFTADEYKNWTILFSMYCVHDSIPQKHVSCFRKFVLACQYLCKEVITQNDLVISHNLLLDFCKCFEKLYGKDRVTPNMHLHIHLKDCVADFGPIYSFWLFSFERYNGILGNIPTNKRDIEIQLMKRFCRDIYVANIPSIMTFDNIDSYLIAKLAAVEKGTLKDMKSSVKQELALYSSRFIDVQNCTLFNSDLIESKDKEVVFSLSSLQLEHLTSTYKRLYPDLDVKNAVISASCFKCLHITVAGHEYRSLNSRSARSACIVAYWCSNSGKIVETNDIGFQPRPGLIDYFIKHRALVGNGYVESWFACMRWFLPVKDEIRHKFGKPVEVWHQQHFEDMGPSSFLPVQRIFAKAVYAEFVYKSCNLIAVIPRLKHSLISENV